VSGHVIDRLTEKIVKNVIKDEIDHISAYLCGHKLSELLFRHYNEKIGRENCKILCFKILCSKVSEKWRLFCFVLTTPLKNDSIVFTVVFIVVFRHYNDKTGRGNCKILCSKVVFTIVFNHSIGGRLSSSDFRRATFAFVARLLVTNLLVLIYLPNSGRLVERIQKLL